MTGTYRYNYRSQVLGDYNLVFNNVHYSSFSCFGVGLTFFCVSMVHARDCKDMCSHAYRGQSRTFGVLLNPSLSFCFETKSFTNLKSHHFA